MKKTISILSIFLLAFSMAWAQDYPKTTIDGKEFYQYTPEKGKGYYDINRKFGVSQAEVEEYNPYLKEKGIQANKIILIPVKKTESKPAAIVAETTVKQQINFTEHTVEKKETVFSIAQKYGVAIDSIYKYNPDSREKIRKGDVLKIPQYTAKPVEVKQEVVLPAEPAKSGVKVAFLLPFMLDAKKPDPTADKFFDFYQGALLAVEVLKKQGISVDVYTYDTDKTKKKIDSLLLKPELKTVDLIIGPAYTEQVKAVTDFAKAHKIHVVIPFSAKTEVTNNNEFVYQANTRQDVFDEAIADLFVDTFKDKNIVILNFNDGSQDTYKDLFDFTTKKLKSSHIDYVVRNLSLDSVAQYDLDIDLISGKENIVFPLTANSATLARLVPILNKADKDFSYFGLQSWTQLKIQETIFAHNTYIASAFFVDYQEKTTKNFFGKYADSFGTESVRVTPHYNLLGYDIALYFIAGLSKYGKDFENSMSKIGVETLQTRFKFEKLSPASGYMNKNVFLIKYKGSDKTKLK
ncbi:MAG: ABC transporter substrate-binding protein [Prevotellaceae bacterium]|jgi:LysM repeat protein/ABC-type branched-subunit amino acid transport system substrate-binding protein|nr:ABC transporter substrate-binding protein [Prevotellaceae bacterium]